jgi:hypothetical protein
MSDEKKKKEKAGLNEVFICNVCAKAFMDRSATLPIDIEMSDAVVQVGKVVPHAKYPDDAELATVMYEDVAGQDVKIPAVDASACCANNTALCHSMRLRFRREADGVHIIGAGRKE